MTLLDTDTLSLLFHDHEKVKQRVAQVRDTIAITVVTRIEVLRGRFDALLKAANGEELLRAESHLRRSEQNLNTYVLVGIDAASAAEFDKLRRDRRLKKAGRADLLIAGIALADKALLVTRNLRHFGLIAGLRLENWAD